MLLKDTKLVQLYQDTPPHCYLASNFNNFHCVSGHFEPSPTTESHMQQCIISSTFLEPDSYNILSVWSTLLFFDGHRPGYDCSIPFVSKHWLSPLWTVLQLNHLRDIHVNQSSFCKNISSKCGHYYMAVGNKNQMNLK